VTLVGAAVTPASGQTWPDAIAHFESVAGRALPVRRCYDATPPADITASQMRFDLGVRRSVYSFKPTMSTPLSTLESLAASIANAGHLCDVIIYHEPVDNMSGPDFIALYQRSAEPFRMAGIPTGVCFTNWSCNLPYSDSKSALARYWPGDDAVDFITIDEYPIGEIPAAGSTSTKDALPMDARTRRVCQFADARGIPLGLAEYGVDSAWDVTKADRWLRSVTDWAAARAQAGRPLRWACYFSSNVTGSYSYALDGRQEYVDAYTDSYHLLEG
jgi:hypothetical protein